MSGGALIRHWPHGDPHDLARAIVGDRRYELATASTAGATWVDLLRDWLFGMLRRLLHAVDHALGAGNPLDVFIGFGVIAAAAAMLGFGVYVVVRSLARGVGPSARPERAPIVGQTLRTAAELRAAARAAGQARRYRDAAGLLFASAARALDEGGRLAYDPARTPGEYRRLVRDPLFDALAGDAIVALFAPAEPRDELFERMSVAYDRLFADMRGR